MAAETRRQLPDGYTWQEVPELGASFPKPHDWFYRYDAVRDTKACFITREPIRIGSVPEGSLEAIAEETAKNGFKTGLSINVFDRYTAKSRQSVISAARGMITEAREPLALLTSVQRVKNGQLVSFRGEYYSRITKVGDIQIHPIHYYIEATADPKNDRLYILNFETPEDLWDQDKAVAKLMVEGRVFEN